ncbi:hypothetical protein [Halomonas sp. Mc5H-6]|uniref:hypothetical protein n=1 Tax=Halomonas sp. Mc5H-6 TaxID=2954500 RepID=UPI00209705E1|nr:hypothetical protein [Halomonas sp. Mc5H-6]MCO7248229.1 hypothetical protein [Halomonas sp. Mc5H-6]
MIKLAETPPDGHTPDLTITHLMWTPNERLMYGIEYGYFETELADGREEDASRVMVAAQYSF